LTGLQSWNRRQQDLQSGRRYVSPAYVEPEILPLGISTIMCSLSSRSTAIAAVTLLLCAPVGVLGQTPADAYWDTRFGYVPAGGAATYSQEGLVMLGQFGCIGEADPEEAGPGAIYQCALAFWDGQGWRLAGPMRQGSNSLMGLISPKNAAGIYVLGDLTTVDGHQVEHGAFWTGNEWFPTTGGLNNAILALEHHETGLYGGGFFHQANGDVVNHIARFNGATWEPLIQDQLARGVNSTVWALGSSNDLIFLGGDFTVAGNVVGANCIASWDMVQKKFAKMGTGLPCNPGTLTVPQRLLNVGGHLYALLRNGSLYRREHGGDWTPVNVPNTFSGLHAVLPTNSGIYATGGIPFSLGAYVVFDGTEWKPVGVGGQGAGRWVTGTDEAVFAAMDNLFDGRRLHGVGRWDLTDWSQLGNGLGNVLAPAGESGRPVRAFAYSGGNLYAGGSFLFAGAERAAGLARWDRQQWRPIPGDPFDVMALVPYGNGVVAGGGIITQGGVTFNGIGHWTGTQWEPLGTGLTGSSPSIPSRAFSLLRHGTDLYAGGEFFHAGDAPARGVARWDGQQWHALGTGLGAGSVYALASHDGKIYAGGDFTRLGTGMYAPSVAAWDGTEWSAVGDINAGAFGDVRALVSYDGHLYAAHNSRGLLRWIDGDWQLVAEFTALFGSPTRQRVAPRALLVNGNDLYVGGEFSRVGDQRAWRVARWNGTEWSGLGSGLWRAAGDHFASQYPFVLALAGTEDGLWSGGWFSRAGNTPSTNVALWRNFDLATSVDYERPPRSLSLGAAYPNPASTTAQFMLHAGARASITVEVFDMLGRKMTVPCDLHRLNEDLWRIELPVAQLASGLYMVRVSDGERLVSRALVVSR
jgi:trimeric autotransporter adhesin